jgi:hypothetical protein
LSIAQLKQTYSGELCFFIKKLIVNEDGDAIEDEFGPVGVAPVAGQGKINFQMEQAKKYKFTEDDDFVI